MPMLRIVCVVGRSVATISRALRTLGLSSLKALEPRAEVLRYERERPGEMLHMDTKKLGRIVKPGHRVTGNPRDSVVGAGWEIAHVTIDDHSRTGFVQLLVNERKDSAVEFLKAAVAHYAALGVKIERLLTDRGSVYRSWLFNKSCDGLGIKHIYLQPYRPQTNGKAERFIQTCLREWPTFAAMTAALSESGCPTSSTTTTPVGPIRPRALSLQPLDLAGTTYCAVGTHLKTDGLGRVDRRASQTLRWPVSPKRQKRPSVQPGTSPAAATHSISTRAPKASPRQPKALRAGSGCAPKNSR